MGKKKKPSADNVRNKRKEKEKKANMFEVKINRQKHPVLGRKLSKHDKGMPGHSRSKATKRRKETLLKEYDRQFKANRFVDKRFGETDATLSLEDKMMKRYALERSRSGVKTKFSLNDEEELTHYGQSLAEIEKFDEPVISDDDDDDDDKRAAAKMVSEQHFGGFLKRKWEGPDGDKDKRTWKEKMEDLITESRKAKHERQKEKEKNYELTNDVDEQWNELHTLVRSRKPKLQVEDSKPKNDDYDIVVRELMFESRGKATDRLKTEEELAKEEKERLDKLEADRRRRMKGITEEEEAAEAAKHRSADDLDDGFGLEPAIFDYVSYKDGKLLTEDAGSGDNDGEDGSGDEMDDEDDDEQGGDDEDGDDAGSDAEAADAEMEAGSGDSDEESDDDSEEDDYEDLQSDEEGMEEETEKKSDETKEKSELSRKKKEASSTEDKETLIEMAKKELPYTFKAPETYDEMLDMLEGHDLENQLTIIDRIRKCHHPSLAEGNKEKLELLFSHLVQFYGELCVQDPPQLDFVDRLMKPLFELCQMSPVPAAKALIGHLTERQEEFRQICEKRSGRGLYPALDTLLIFKLIAVLFPTSDFYHHVTTPSMMFMGQLLAQCPVNHGRDVVAGLLLCSMCLEYVSRSKRIVPEAINFLHGLLYIATTKSVNTIMTVIPPFRPVGKGADLLHLLSDAKSISPKNWSMTEMLAPEVDQDLYGTDEFRVTALHHCFTLLQAFLKLYSSYPASRELFGPVVTMCEKLPTDKYPLDLQDAISTFVTQCKEMCTGERRSLSMEKKKPKPLKMFEPQIEESFDGKKIHGKKGTREFNEKQKLIHKHKKEMKGARRELKKDTQFLARQKLREQLERDAERRQKVKALYGALANQEGDYQKMKHGKRPDS